MTRVKICGVRTLDGARAVREAGADLAGLNFVPSSKRAIDLIHARRIAEALRPVALVGVFKDQPLAEICEVAKTLALDYLQLHGRESPEECRLLAAVCPVIKAIAVAESFTAASTAPYVEHAAFFLFDGPIAGSGQPFPWDAIARERIARPYLIAGGLTPENVSEPIARARPWGVDTASGVERGGAQDPERIFLFVKEAKRA